MRARKASIVRNTTETQIKVSLDLNGTGRYRIRTSMPFLDHMLSVMARHGCMDLVVSAKGDIEVDYHHTVEDIGIVIGQAMAKALADKRQITRFGSFAVPMDETLARVDLDISARPYLVYQVALPKKRKIRDFDLDLIEEFFRALVTASGMTLHINVPYGKNPHHIVEAVFKAFGRALDQATKRDTRVRGIPSTKGKLS
jgi:imidazoleglycerol-phosphate dehydratase